MGKRKDSWPDSKLALLKRLINEGELSPGEIADEMGKSYAATYAQARALGLKLVKIAPAQTSIGRKTDERRKIIRVGVDFTESEHRRIEAAAVLSGMAPGKFMERAIGGSPVLKTTILRLADKTIAKAIK